MNFIESPPLPPPLPPRPSLKGPDDGVSLDLSAHSLSAVMATAGRMNQRPTDSQTLYHTCINCLSLVYCRNRNTLEEVAALQLLLKSMAKTCWKKSCSPFCVLNGFLPHSFVFDVSCYCKAFLSPILTIITNRHRVLYASNCDD